MNALTHTQLHKKVAVNERDMFEWHYLLEGPDGFSLSLAQTHSLYIYAHAHIHYIPDTNKQVLSSTLPLCEYYLYQLSLTYLLSTFLFDALRI